jgi:hypothetical protein
MWYSTCADKQDLATLSSPETELQPQPDSLTLLPPVPDATEPSACLRPEEPRATAIGDRRVAVATPGTEYWLP